MDYTEVRGSKPINTVAASYGIIEYIEVSKLMVSNNIIFTNYRANIIDTNIGDYFEDQLSSQDEMNRVILNL